MTTNKTDDLGISNDVLADYIKRYEAAVNHVFKDYPKQPSIYSHERQEYSGLDINTYIYIADNYCHLKKRLEERNARSKIPNKKLSYAKILKKRVSSWLLIKAQNKPAS